MLSGKRCLMYKINENLIFFNSRAVGLMNAMPSNNCENVICVVCGREFEWITKLGSSVSIDKLCKWLIAMRVVLLINSIL